nr:L2 [Columba livia papillomavirus 1]
MTLPRLYRVTIPRPYARLQRVRRFVALAYGSIKTVGSAEPVTIGRRRRAADDDLWRGCQYGDCPPDIRDKYTQNTVADQILKWASAGVFLGGLGIGTGSSGSGGGGETILGVPWPGPSERAPGTSFIPREQPFSLPTGELPVRVDGTQPPDPVTIGPVPEPPDDSPNVFVNPAFEEDIVSISHSDSVVIGDPAPVPEPPTLGSEFPFDTRTTRGDTFESTHVVAAVTPFDTEIMQPWVPTRAPGAPFEEVELSTFGAGRVDRADVDLQETSFGMTDERQYTSTPDPYVSRASSARPSRARPSAMQHTIENPTYDPRLGVDTLYEEGLRDWVDQDVIIGPEVFGETAEGRVTVSRSLAAAGATLRSGRRLRLPLRIVFEVSSVGEDVQGIELTSFLPEGSFGRVLDTSLSGETGFTEASTMPWSGSAVDSTAVSGDSFYDVPLDDPFPEMEIIEDEDEEIGVTRGIGGIDGGYGARAGGGTVQLLDSKVPVVLPGGPKTVIPFEVQPWYPLVPVDYGYNDGLLVWFLRRRRRRRRRGASLQFLYR